jgi:hypothetical protein
MSEATGTAAEAIIPSGIGPLPVVAPATGSRAGQPRCEDCFFHQQMLCALEDKKPCPTFRPAHPDGLRPPRQLSFVFRQQRRQDPFAFEHAA